MKQKLFNRFYMLLYASARYFFFLSLMGCLNDGYIRHKLRLSVHGTTCALRAALCKVRCLKIFVWRFRITRYVVENVFNCFRPRFGAKYYRPEIEYPALSHFSFARSLIKITMSFRTLCTFQTFDEGAIKLHTESLTSL